MRVRVISNQDERCGNAEYARLLTRELKKHLPDVTLGEQPEDADVLMVSWCPSVVGYSAEAGNFWRSEGRKVILIHQQSLGDEFIGKELMESAHRVVTHEPTNWGSVYIPHGIPVVDGVHEQSKELTVGMAGFYFRTTKQFQSVLHVALMMGALGNFVFAPHPLNKDYIADDARQYRSQLREGSRVVDTWLPVEAVVQLMGWSTVNIFWFFEDSPYEMSGQSGSVGLGLAAGRPVIVSNSRKFRVLKELYGDEIYVANSKKELELEILRIVADPNPKLPKRILKDMGWDTTGRQYAELIKSL